MKANTEDKKILDEFFSNAESFTNYIESKIQNGTLSDVTSKRKFDLFKNSLQSLMNAIELEK